MLPTRQARHTKTHTFQASKDLVDRPLLHDIRFQNYMFQHTYTLVTRKYLGSNIPPGNH